MTESGPEAGTRTQREHRGTHQGSVPRPRGPGGPARPRDHGSWAPKVSRLSVPRRGAGANVGGRRLTGPVQGFGRMWQKTYRLELGPAISPESAIATWKAHFGEFWPGGSRFQGSLTGITPGDVALLDVGIGGGVRLSTGVFVLYADDESFTLMTPQGHMFAGWITFSASRVEQAAAGGGDLAEVTVIQAQLLMRANDPLYELGLSLGGHRMEDQFWARTLTALGRFLGAPPAPVHTRTVCVDPRRQWRRAGQVWHNSLVRTMMRAVAEPMNAALRGRRAS
jgi:hypothetical protein